MSEYLDESNAVTKDQKALGFKWLVCYVPQQGEPHHPIERRQAFRFFEHEPTASEIERAYAWPLTMLQRAVVIKISSSTTYEARPDPKGVLIRTLKDLVHDTHGAFDEKLIFDAADYIWEEVVDR